MNDQSPPGPPVYPWNHNRPFNDFSGFLTRLFGHRIQKLSIDAGFTCPNRDGTKGWGGCTFCNNKTFNPAYCTPEETVTRQLERGIGFFNTKYPDQQYFAYFQAYTNTYSDFDHLVSLYEEALRHPKIVGLVVGTRPDCLSDEIIHWFSNLSKTRYVAVELGIESINDQTLRRINRGHTYQDSVEAINRCHGKGFYTGAHLIFGLPGEPVEEMIGSALEISRLPLDLLKIHQLQIIAGTAMESDYHQNPSDFVIFSIEDYIDLIIRFLENLKPEIIIERFVNVSPPGMIAGKRWGIKNHELVARIEREMIRRGTWQGRLYVP